MTLASHLRRQNKSISDLRMSEFFLRVRVPFGRPMFRSPFQFYMADGLDTRGNDAGLFSSTFESHHLASDIIVHRSTARS